MRMVVQFCAFLCCLLSFASVAQKPSIPISEGTYQAGGSSPLVDIYLPSPPADDQRFQVIASYNLTTPNAPSASFSCMGYTNGTLQRVQLSCRLDRKLSGGEYRSKGDVTLTREEQGDTTTITGIRFPILTILSNPFSPTVFPKISGAALHMTPDQALSDGALRTKIVFDELAAHFPSTVRDNKEVRSYLLARVDDEKVIIALTQRRYSAGLEGSLMPGMGSGSLNPAFFQDFDRRLDKITNELGGSPKQHAAVTREREKPHFLLAQMPQTSEAVTTYASPEELLLAYTDLVNVLNGAEKAFNLMASSGRRFFIWSATTKPVFAIIHYSRLGEDEKTWSAPTNFKGALLEYAYWTFRFDWAGCSKTVSPDPYIEGSIDMEVSKDGCKTK